MTKVIRVLMVCLGNICRSPAAEGVLRRMIEDAGLRERIVVDSAGTGDWHAGDGPDDRMIKHALARGYDLRQLEARQIVYPADFERFDYILTMDDANLRSVRALDHAGTTRARILPLVSFCTVHDVREIPDPYLREADGFELVLDYVEDACRGFLSTLGRDVA